jgi:hypothetical protein
MHSFDRTGRSLKTASTGTRIARNAGKVAEATHSLSCVTITAYPETTGSETGAYESHPAVFPQPQGGEARLAV